MTSPVLLGALLGAAVLHELGHWAMLRRFRGGVKKLTVSPFGIEMTLSDDTRLSYGREMLVTLAGPLVNILFALFLGLLGEIWEMAYVFAGAQLILGLFNLVPSAPLDGGRLLWLVTAWLTEPFTADRVTNLVGVVVSSALLVCGVLLMQRLGGSPFLLLGAVGLLISSLREKGLVKFTMAR